MSATTVTKQRTTRTLSSLEANAGVHYGDWRDEFFKQGFYVFKQAVPAEKATDYYYAKALSWLQSFNTAFDINDKKTWIQDNLPQSFKNMYLGYCAAHEKFMWDART